MSALRIACTDVLGVACPACGEGVGIECFPDDTCEERWQLADANAEILTLDSEGFLANSRGVRVARVRSLTLDLSAARLTGGGGPGQAVDVGLPTGAAGTHAVGDAPEKSDPGTQQRASAHTRAGASDSSEVTEIWDHYQTTIPGAKRQTLEEKRRRIIRNALKVRSVDECKRAIDGLAASRHHNGQNEQKKKYLGIQYALRGIGAEGNDERIDKMCALAGPTEDAAIAGVPSGARAMVRDRQRLVEEMLMHPGDVTRRERARGSAQYLHETFGLNARVVVSLDGGELRSVLWTREMMRKPSAVDS